MQADLYLAATFWFSVAAFAISSGATIYAYWATRSKARRDEVDQRVGALEDRVTTVERDQYHTPTHQDIGRVYERLNETNNALAELSGKLGNVVTSLDRVQSYLLRQRGTGE